MRAGVAFLIFSVALVQSHPAQSVDEVESARAVAKPFLIAFYQNDREMAANFAAQADDLDRFVGKKNLDTETKEQVRSEIEELEIDLTSDYVNLAESVQGDSLPVGCPLRFNFAYRGRPMVLSMLKTENGWKVDLRWWVAMIRLAEGQELSENNPEVIIRRFLLALMKRDTEKLARLLPKGHTPDQLYPRGYKPPFEDQYFYLAMEMPLVEFGKGDLVLTPDGTLEPALRPGTDDRFFLGIFWDSELHFRLLREGQSFKVEPGEHLSRMGL